MSESPKVERRHFTRIGFDTNVTLKQGELTHATPLLDISLKGVLVAKPSEYQIKSTDPVHIHIALADETQIHMRAELVHNSETVLGFKCESIDMDSLAHLRRLIELNLDEPNAAERVLSELINSIE